MLHLVLAASAPIVDTHSSAYQTGAFFGRIFVGLLVVAIVWRLVKWMRR